MGLDVGVNSWVTIAEADSYISNKINSNIWPLDNDTKAKYLIMAFYAIYTSPDLNIQKNSINEKVKISQMELALWFVGNYTAFSKRQALQSMGVTSFSADSVSENYNEKGSLTLPAFIKDLLSDFMHGSTVATFNRDVEYYR